MADQKILTALIVGSVSEPSLNRRLAHALTLLAPRVGLELREVPIGGLPFYGTQFDHDYPPEGLALKEALAEAEGLVIVTPEYNRSIPGVLKNAIDWASRKGTAREAAPLAGKRVCIVGASPGITGTVRAQDALRLVLRRAGAVVEPQGEVLVFQAHTKVADGRLVDERTREALARHLQFFVAPAGRAS